MFLAIKILFNFVVLPRVRVRSRVRVRFRVRVRVTVRVSFSHRFHSHNTTFFKENQQP